MNSSTLAPWVRVHRVLGPHCRQCQPDQLRRRPPAQFPPSREPCVPPHDLVNKSIWPGSLREVLIQVNDHVVALLGSGDTRQTLALRRHCACGIADGLCTQYIIGDGSAAGASGTNPCPGNSPGGMRSGRRALCCRKPRRQEHRPWLLCWAARGRAPVSPSPLQKEAEDNRGPQS